MFFNNKIYFFLILFFAKYILVFGQGENENWYFGNGAGIKFDINGGTTVLNNSQLFSIEGCSVISDKLGNLLFYTDGETVYDSSHSIMLNGENLNGSSSSTQSSLIVAKPNSSNIYFIFTVDTNTASGIDDGFSYSVVDINLNDGKGAVIQKNINLLTNTSEKLTQVVKSCSSKSSWIITFASENGDDNVFNTFHAFEVDSSGVSNNSIKSTFESLEIIDDRGYLKASLDGSKLASANVKDSLYVYDFDKETGKVFNQKKINISAADGANAAYGIEFSPSGQFLYVHASNRLSSRDGHKSSLLQYDLWTENISDSQVLIEHRDLFRGALQMGINGKIYRTLPYNYHNGTPYLGVITNPDEKGSLANYEHNAIDLDGNNATQGLPFLTPMFFEEDIHLTSNNPCSGETLILEVDSIPGANYYWKKDDKIIPDAISSKLSIQSVNHYDSGKYSVLISKPFIKYCDLIKEINVQIEELIEPSSPIISVCDIDLDNSVDGITEINLTQVHNNLGLEYYFYESIEDRSQNNFITNPENYRNAQAFNQIIFYKFYNSSGCESLGEIEINVEPIPSIDFQKTYYLCDSDILEINAPNTFDSYKWLKIEEDNEILISSEKDVQIFSIGEYILEAKTISLFKEIECINSVKFEVKPSNKATLNIIVNDLSEDNTIEIEAVGNGDYEYSLDGVSFQDLNIFNKVSSGFVTIYVKDKNGCGLVEKRIEIDPELSIESFPKFFTPNGDGFNDYWQYNPIYSYGDIKVKTIHIFNRQGMIVANIDPKSKGWDGNYNGQQLEATDYWYVAISFSNKTIKGHFSLIR
ncbi:T9SS type B sorting domain-containing protein [Maribacter sp. MAR_2009_72]|uniref:T9SS type B sorting domain-containing protein n=1 Tax=Maribacter sp. MAR_2009_72 TaxID=1250050 RepID=UPI00119BE226|nr:T9SS type B sorting domain-containing protein [Maribacter sp. MAR_2009_72]TVZ16943.1 gliding motility-associated-like protein [Maribacter sp. MAR_2009_72]